MKLKRTSRLLLWLFAVILGTLFSSQGSQISKAQTNRSTSFGPQYTPVPRYALDRVIVKFKGGQFRLQALSEVKSQYGLQSIKEFRNLNIYVFKLPKDKTPHEAIAELRKRPDVEYAEPDYIYTIKATIPNDPLWNNLWGLAKIQAPLAWDITRGSQSVVVAVIDTGVDYNHPDLKDNMWKDPATGYYGKNCITGASNPNDPMDDNGHGTHVAGTIGAVGNNGVGVVGVNWQVKIMALKAGDSSGISLSAAIDCINYAIQKGAHIINASWGDYAYSQTLRNAIASAKNAGILFVAAAGNEEYDNDLTPLYPASYDLENIISVAATDQNDLLASFSNYGRNSVHVGAPGVGILSTLPNNNYGNKSGTSMASPHVAGLAALLKAQNPSYTWRELKCRIMKGVDPLSSLNGKTITGGRINASKALTISDCQPGTFYFLLVDVRGLGAVDGNVGVYNNGSTATLTATPTPYTGASFKGWSGDCSACGTSTTCQIVMNSDKKCVAVFDKVVVAVIKSGEGKGTIISNPTGINCGDTCYGIFNEGSSITLQATPDSISAFKIWLGDCESCGNNPICTITANNDKACIAYFVRSKYILSISKSGTGTGTITSDPAGINCGTTCSANFDPNTSVTLTATPDAGSTFGGWGGDCQSCGMGSQCTISMNSDKSCYAIFNFPVSSSSSGGGGGCSMVASSNPLNALFWLLPPILIAFRRALRS